MSPASSVQTSRFEQCLPTHHSYRGTNHSGTLLWKTKLLQLEDIRFFEGSREIDKLTELHTTVPDKVSVQFHRQKNNMKDAVITMHRTNDVLCPVETWKRIVLRIRAYPNTSLKSCVNTVRKQNKNYKIKSSTVLQHIRNTVALLGKDTLGITGNEVGTHSIRSSQNHDARTMEKPSIFAIYTYPSERFQRRSQQQNAP